MNKFTCRMFLRLALILVLVLPACNRNSGGSSGGNNEAPPFSAKSITFTPTGPGQAGDIWLELVSAKPAENSFQLKLIGDGVQGVYGVAGRLTFDRKIAELTNATAGDALSGMGATIIVRGTSNEEGGVFGVSRSVDFSNNVDLVADKVIATLNFKVTAKGTTDLTFDDKRSRSMNNGLAVVDVAHWLGGKLSVE